MSKAIIWIASGQRYIDEAIVSARSALYHNPNIPRILYTDKLGVYPNFTDVAMLLPRQYDLWFLDCTYHLRSIFDSLPNKVLLLDTDTYVCDDLTDYFTILDRFNIAGTHAPGRETAPTIKNVPASFPELHIGALAFNKNGIIEKLFNLWLKFYQDNQDVYKENDQAPLRDALWHYQGASVYAMPPEFCFRFPFGGQLRGKVKVLHGRSHMPYDKIEGAVNQHWRKIRVFQRGTFR